MTRGTDDSGNALRRLLYVTQLLVLVAAGVVLAGATGGIAGLVSGLLFALLGGATVVGLWRERTGRRGTHTGTAEDITHDPFGDPGQAAKQRWRRAIRRLPGEDDER